MATLEQNIRQTNSDFQAIKAKIVEKGVAIADGIRTSEYALKVDEVYEAGRRKEYDDFWDTFQQDGKRVNYDFAFARGWKDSTLKPKYDIKPTSADHIFYVCEIKTDLREILKEQGITLDFSKATNVPFAFAASHFTALPTIDLTGISETSQYGGIFGWARYLHTIDKIIIKDDGSTPFTVGWFEEAAALVEIRFDGTIGKNNLNLKWSPKLSKASITNIIDRLSSSTSGLTVTFSQTAVNNAFTTAEWNALEATKTNWTISLL